MAKVKIKALKNGPYLVGGVALCRCGSSNNKPYCDGSHSKVGFEGEGKELEIEL